MKCPFCSKELLQGENRRFTDTCDHVSDPNGDYPRPLRPTFVCSCFYSKDCFWDGAGGFYSGRNESMTYSERKKMFPSRDCWPALGSFDEWFSNKKGFADKIRPWLFWLKGNDRYFLSGRIARVIYKRSEPKILF